MTGREDRGTSEGLLMDVLFLDLGTVYTGMFTQ